MIKQGILAMQSQVETVGKELFKKAIESIAKKTKRAITLKKVVAVVKILAFTALIIGVAALSIAATVLTGGAAAPLILGAIVTGLGPPRKSTTPPTRLGRYAAKLPPRSLRRSTPTKKLLPTRTRSSWTRRFATLVRKNASSAS